MTFEIRAEEQTDSTWTVVLYDDGQAVTIWPAYPTALIAKVGAVRMREQKELRRDTPIVMVPLDKARP